MLSINDSPTPTADLLRHQRLQAVEHIQASLLGRDVLFLCDLSISHPDMLTTIDQKRQHVCCGRKNIRFFCLIPFNRGSKWLRHLYLMHTSSALRFFMNCILLLHLSVIFLLPATAEELASVGAASWVLAVEAICLFFEVGRTCIDIAIKYQLQPKDFKGVKHPAAAFSSRTTNPVIDFLNVILLALVTFDYLALLNRSTFQYIIPLRPLLLIFRNRNVLQIAKIYFKCIWAARSVLLMYVTWLMVTTVWAMILFRTVINPDFSTPGASSYNNIVRALMTMFVHMSTTENIYDLLYPLYALQPWSPLFLLFCTFTGQLYVIGNILGLFQNEFSRLREEIVEENEAFAHAGMVAGFILLDIDNSHSLSRHEVYKFLTAINPDVSSEWFETAFAKMNSSDELDDSVDIKEFVDFMTHHSVPAILRASSKRQGNKFLRTVVDNQYFFSLQLFVVLAHMWCCSFYGVYDDTVLDAIQLGVCCWYAIEMAVRIFAYSWDTFINYALHYPDQKNSDAMQTVHRLDVFVVGATIAGNIIVRVIGNFFLYFGRSTLSNDAFRFLLVLPLIRLLLIVEAIRNPFFLLLRLGPRISHVLITILMFFLIFAILGVNQFHDWDLVLSGNLIPPGSFQNLGQAFRSILQMLTASNWNDLMYAAVNYAGFGYTWYFFSFMALSIISVNLIVSLVLESNDDDHRQQLKKDVQQVLSFPFFSVL